MAKAIGGYSALKSATAAIPVAMPMHVVTSWRIRLNNSCLGVMRTVTMDSCYGEVFGSFCHGLLLSFCLQPYFLQSAE